MAVGICITIFQFYLYYLYGIVWFLSEDMAIGGNVFYFHSRGGNIVKHPQFQQSCAQVTANRQVFIGNDEASLLR